MKPYLLFDHDGVLVDTEYWYFQANQRVLAEIGIVLDQEQHLKNMSHGTTVWDWVASLDMKIAKSTIEEQRTKRNQYYQQYLKTENIEISGAENVLQTLSQTHQMAIITMSKRGDFELIHRNRSIVQYMDFVLVREDFNQTKPHPEPYLKGLEKFGCTKEDALVIEDSERGLKSAVAAGIDCAVIHHEFTQTYDFSAATYHLQSLEELLSLLNV